MVNIGAPDLPYLVLTPYVIFTPCRPSGGEIGQIGCACWYFLFWRALSPLEAYEYHLMDGSHPGLSNNNVEEISPICANDVVSLSRDGPSLPPHPPFPYLRSAVLVPRQELLCLSFQTMGHNACHQIPLTLVLR